MEQTSKTAGDFADTAGEAANAQRILTAQMEDAKAKIGTQLMPVWAELLSVGRDLTYVLDNLAGSTEEGTSKLTEYTGMMLSTIPVLGQVIKLVQDEADSQRTRAAALEDAREAAERDAAGGETYLRYLNEAARLAVKNTDAVEDTTTALQDQANALKALVDPAFAVFDAYSNTRKATDAYNTALAETGPNSVATRDAAKNLAEAIIGLEGANARFAVEGGQASIDALVEMLRQSGVAEQVIRNLILAITDYNNTPIVNKPIQFNPVTGAPVRTPIAGPFHTGGIVPGTPGSDVPIMAQAGETVIPAGGGAGGSGLTIIVQGSVVTKDQLIDEVRRGIIKLQRRNGTSGIL
jgi:hypothetical protein